MGSENEHRSRHLKENGAVPGKKMHNERLETRIANDAISCGGDMIGDESTPHSGAVEDTAWLWGVTLLVDVLLRWP